MRQDAAPGVAGPFPVTQVVGGFRSSGLTGMPPAGSNLNGLHQLTIVYKFLGDVLRGSIEGGELIGLA